MQTFYLQKNIFQHCKYLGSLQSTSAYTSVQSIQCCITIVTVKVIVCWPQAQKVCPSCVSFALTWFSLDIVILQGLHRLFQICVFVYHFGFNGIQP